MGDKAKKAPEGVRKWERCIAAYDREFKKWEGRVEKILKRYRDDPRDGRQTYTTSKYNILWSNVQTLSAAVYSRLPQPDVSRRFKDNDPVGRVASMILQRGLEYEIQHYPDYRQTMRESVLDRFLGGRGTAWVRYEPHFRAMATGAPVDGELVSEDVDEPQEELDYECAPTDYVHWKDFGHTVARTWEEVTAVWRRVYMTRQMLVERFGEEGEKIPLDTKPEDAKKATGEEGEEGYRAVVYEIWDKETKEAIWYSKSLGKELDRKPDPLGLEEFFPCPRPLFATTTNESLVPLPDFTLYQDQANELDTLSDRINGLIKALQVKGVYDATQPEIGRLFTEGENNTLIPVKNWAAFAEKQGLKGSIDLVEIKPIAEALNYAYQAMEQVKQQVYDITGISDIVRGQSAASETATAQQIKGQYASLRLKVMQEQVAQYANDLLQLKAQVMCRKFSPETLAQIAAVDQLSDQDKQLIVPALTLLVGEDRMQNPDADGVNPLRSFRVEVNADSLVQLDEQAEKEARVEFLTATGTFIEKAAMVGGQSPELIPLLMDMLKFGVTGFKVGRAMEGQFDEATEKLKMAIQQKMQAPPPPNPEVLKIQQESQIEIQRMQQEAQIEEQKFQREGQMKIAQVQQEGRLKAEQMQAELAIEREKHMAYLELEKWKAEQEAELAVYKANLDAQVKDRANDLKESELKDSEEGRKHESEKSERENEAVSKASEMLAEAAKAVATSAETMATAAEHLTRPKVIVRDQSGRAIGVQAA